MEITPKRWPSKRGQDAALGDAQDGLRCYLSRGMQAGIGIAGDHEGRAVVVAALHHGGDRCNHAFDMGLRIDAGRTFLQRHAFDDRTAGHT